MAIDQSEQTLRFEASARLQRLFGRDLIPDEDSAVEELVKNAYDSNATEVTITIVRPTSDHPGEIEVRDNGLGLSLKEFERVWMRAGYSEKTGQPLPETGRIQVGEKGIGRFAADKLGSRLVVLTKPRRSREALRVTFDWAKFDNKRRLLSDVPIPYDFVSEDLLPRQGSGTILRIAGLRSSWTDKSVESLRRRLSRLLNPYDKTQSFRVILRAPSRKLSGPIVASEIEGAAFEWDIIRNSQGKVRVKRRTRAQSGTPEWGDWEVIPTSAEPQEQADFGPLRARIFFFVDRPKKANVGDSLPGIAVYRDGMRVEPAGSSAADWLGLLEKRAKRAGHMPLVPSRLFGFVEISREDNPQLQDATNRRAFIHGPELDAFRDFLKRRLTELESQVEEEVAKPRWEKSRQVQSQKLVQARYKTVSIMSLSLAHEFRQPLQSIQTAAENISGYLHRAGVRIREVDAATHVIARNVDRIEKHIQFLKAIGAGNQEKEVFSPADAVEEVVAVFREIAQARNIMLMLGPGDETMVIGNRATFLNTLTNLVLNAVQAIDEQEDRATHTVRITIGSDADHSVVRVLDDGPGIPEANRSRLFKRQTTTKQGGMGIGLLVWREALQMFGGELYCESYAAPTIFVVRLPKEASNGARVDS